MKILICSDGKPAADNTTQIGGLLAGPSHAETTLLGITEKPSDERALRDALEAQAQSLRAAGVAPEIVVRAGEPIRQILNQTSTTTYDLVVIGARHTGRTGLYWRSEKTYEVIKAIPPPVLVAIGECDRLKRFLVCTGGKEFIDQALQLTGKVAAAVGASVTLLHVMAEPPAIYADLVRLEEDVNRLLESRSELGLNLRRQKEELERVGVQTEVRVRHGIVIDQVFAEVRQGDHDLIVTGSSQARGMLQHYIMGDLTRSILNHANCPVLVARSGKGATTPGVLNRIKSLFGPKNPRAEIGVIK
jgi:nucleotide-binding universal stress UspA family protein